MQETWVPTLIQEDPTCLGAPKPLHHTHWPQALEQLPKPVHPEPMLPQKRNHRSEKPSSCNWRAGPCSPQLEKVHVVVKTQHSQKWRNEWITLIRKREEHNVSQICKTNLSKVIFFLIKTWPFRVISLAALNIRFDLFKKKSIQPQLLRIYLLCCLTQTFFKPPSTL